MWVISNSPKYGVELGVVAIQSGVRNYCFKDNVRLSKTLKLILSFLVVIASSLPLSKHASIGLHYYSINLRI